jgi:hypothetical protein
MPEAAKANAALARTATWMSFFIMLLPIFPAGIHSSMTFAV